MFVSSPGNMTIIEFGKSDSARSGGQWSILSDVFEIGKLLRRLRPMWIHVCMNPGLLGLSLGLAAPRTTWKTISMVDSRFNNNHSLKRAFSAFLCCLAFDRIDCLCDRTRQLLSTYATNVQKHKLCVAPCSFSDYPSMLGDEERDIDICMIARFVEGKGYELFDRISEHLAKAYKIVLCGSGPNAPANYGFFVGHVDDPYRILKRSKVFLSLQEIDNYPSQSLLEAMASGAAIIATDVGQTRRLLNESNSILIDRCPGQLKVAVETLLSNCQLRDRLAQSGRLDVLREHRVEVYLEYFLDYCGPVGF